ncbi:MAG: multidrug resistance efflux transporter family protein [Clostridiales bacterium]|nr:multidrug resistance efflux transporter family protein [Clostridiales bacterium]
MKKAMCYGILASFFFAFTFLLNRSMNLMGGYWMWSATLRYLFMLPLLALLLSARSVRRKPNSFSASSCFRSVVIAIQAQPIPWVLWSTVGFGLFYLPLTLASLYGESWLTAASWQITIVAGVLLAPIFNKKIPLKNLAISVLILTGVFLLQMQNISGQSIQENCFALIPILIAAFAYPLGNRKMMEYCPSSIDTMERVFGMTLCSLPFWLVCSLAALSMNGLPTSGQMIQSFGVALFSGVIATVLFFHATDLVKNDQRKLAAVEATQCGEVIFTLLGGILILGDPLPDVAGFVGIALIVIGIIANSLISGC